MPISRKKSCARCREAKARCNQAQPLCSRCADRGLRCIYEGDVRAAPYPTVPRIPGSANAQFLQQLGLSEGGERGGLGGLADGMLPDFDSDDGVFWAPASMDNTPTLFTLEKGLLPATPTFMDTYHLSQGRIPDGQAITINNPLPTLTSPPLTSSSSPLCTGQSEATALQHHSQTALNRRPILKHCVLTNILVGQMTSYPRMIIEGESLPPFIHPPCHHGALEYMAPECGENGRHKCLPENLSICSGLVKMFYTRTERNASFVWSSIYTEARRLRDGFTEWDTERQLSALQATTIYMLLQADDTETVEKNGAAELLGCVTEIAWFMAAAHVWESEMPQGRPDRGSWIFNESLARIVVLLGVIELLLTGLSLPPTRNPYPPEQACPGFMSFHLPCHRDLWQARTTRAWRAAYDRYLASRRTAKVLSVGDLVDNEARGDLSDWRGGGDMVHDVVKWCEGLDAMGTLVWMIVPFQKWRRSGEGAVGEVW